VEGNGRSAVADVAELACGPDVDGLPTAPEDTDLLRVRRARTLRRLFVTVLFAVLALGLTGRLGVHSRTMTARGGGWELTVTYAQVSRPGLAVPWSLRIHHPGGFDGPVTISTTASYLEVLDKSASDPTPSNSTATPGAVIWRFDPPPGDTLDISLDARIQPGAHRSRSGETSVLVDGKPVVTARYKTWVLP
jgi:hypothetical protein